MKEYPAAYSIERYLIVLALVAFLVLLNQVFVQPPIMEMTTDAADDQRRGTAADAQPAVGQGGPGA